MSSFHDSTQQSKNIAFQELFSKLSIDHFIQLPRINKIFVNDRIDSSIVNLLSIIFNNLLGSKSIDEKQKQQAQLVSKNHYLMVQKILPILSQHVTYPQPAVHLANFDYEKFRVCCQNSGNENLFRHSKGLIPFINCDSNVIPLFVPFRQQLGYSCYGNQNWRQARSILNMRFESTKNVGQEIKLCQKILLGRPQLADFERQNCWNRVWSELYTYYLTQGLEKLQRYSDGDISNQQIKQNHLRMFEPLEFKYEQQLKSLLQKGKVRQHLVLLLVKSILSNDSKCIQKLIDLLPMDQLTFQSMVIASILYKIFQINEDLQNSGYLFNKFLHYLSQKRYFHDRFIKIFFSDQQIIEYYTNQRDIDLPTVKFSDRVMKKIGQRLIIQKPHLIAQIINYLQGQFKLLKLLQSQQLATKDIGLKLIEILKTDQQNFRRILRNSLDEYGTDKDFEHFILSWQVFHNAVYQGDQSDILFLVTGKSQLYKGFHQGHIYTKGFQMVANSTKKNPKNIYLILRKYGQVISQRLFNQQRLPTQMLSIIFSYKIKEQMSKLGKHENDELWKLFSSVLLRDQGFIEDIMTVR